MKRLWVSKLKYCFGISYHGNLDTKAVSNKETNILQKLKVILPTGLLNASDPVLTIKTMRTSCAKIPKHVMKWR